MDGWVGGTDFVAVTALNDKVKSSRKNLPSALMAL